MLQTVVDIFSTLLGDWISFAYIQEHFLKKESDSNGLLLLEEEDMAMSLCLSYREKLQESLDR